MPTATPLLAHCRVLRAADRGRSRVGRDADVAADALANLVVPALLDLCGKEGVGDRGPRRADQVEDAFLDHPDHRVRRREPADANDWLRRELLEAAHVRLLRTLVGEPRGDRVEVPVSHHEVPQVGELTDEAEHLLGLAALETPFADPLVDADATCHRRSAVHLLEGVLEDLAKQPRAILDAAAVAVLAVVVAPREEVLDGGHIVPGVYVDEVVSAPAAISRLPGGASA